jgi:maleylacetate reductase
VIVRWGLGELQGVLAELGISRPFLIASPRWSRLDLEAAATWDEVPSHRIEVPEGVDGILVVGGGSAIDTGKAASSASGLPMVSVPTTYSGSEWTTSFGVRDPDRKMRGHGSGAHLAGIVYEPELTLELPKGPSAGTAMNALAHTAEALYHPARNPDSDRAAAEGAELIAGSLPAVIADGSNLGPRTTLLHGAARAGEALGRSGLCLAHAMAQALGGRYGLAHGAMNALTLPPALRFNQETVPEAIETFGKAMGTNDPVGKAEELAALGEFGRLRDFGVREDELDDVAEAVAARPGAIANPRPASPAQIRELLAEIY